MDKKTYNELEGISELNIDDADLTLEIADMSFEELLQHIANAPPLVVSAPLKPNQTWGTEKISIRVPRYILDHFREEAIRTGIGYQTLINMQLNEIFDKPKT